MTPADVYGAVYDAAPALRPWLAAHRPAFDATVRRAVAETQRDGYVQRGGSMTIAEREQKIDALLRAHPEWSMSKIAREAGVATTTVISVRERLARGVGRSQMDPTRKVGPQRREASAEYWATRAGAEPDREVYVKPAVLEWLREHGSAPLVDALDLAPRHATQHWFRVTFTAALRDEAARLLRGILPAWREEYATGSGWDGRAVARRLVEQAEEVLTGLGVAVPTTADVSRVVRVVPMLRDALAARGVAQAHAATLHKETHKWEIALAPSEVPAFLSALRALIASSTVARDAASGMDRSRLTRMIKDAEAARAALGE
jgi:hypothetical protein